MTTILVIGWCSVLLRVQSFIPFQLPVVFPFRSFQTFDYYLCCYVFLVCPRSVLHVPLIHCCIIIRYSPVCPKSVLASLL
ncbi:hypothetical protein BKA65DRAFT_496386, partial [Rhexocercosporidium sp. MPI-PUGE-AT-0058]